jgi:hypothetical protein
MDMAISKNTATSPSSVGADEELWQQLKQVIADSSGFKRWQTTRKLDAVDDAVDSVNGDRLLLDDLVRRYLRETLETLAY